VQRVSTRLTIRAGVLVPATPQQAWELAVNWDRQREWILATSVRGGHGLGAKVTGRTGIGPVGFTDPMLITQWQPPRRCVLTHQGKLVRGAGIFEVLPCQDGPGGSFARSEFRWSEELELPLPPVIARPLATALIGPLARLGLGWSLRRFARLVGLANSPG
jgi:hypothetical protein